MCWKGTSRLLCTGLDKLGLSNHNASFALDGSLSFGKRRADLRLIGAGLARLMKNIGLACLCTGFARLKRSLSVDLMLLKSSINLSCFSTGHNLLKRGRPQSL